MSPDPGTSRHDPSHEASRDLLPWYVNGTLDAGECAVVEAHLEDCPVCRDEVVFLGGLERAVRAAADPPSVADGFDEVLARIGSPRIALRASPAVRWVLTGQAAAILALLAILLWPATNRQPRSYETLSDLGVAKPIEEVLLRVVFHERATEAEIRGLLESIDAQIVAGPSSAGAYTLGAGGGAHEDRAREALLERLRGEPLIRLAEPVVVAPPP